MLSKLINVPYKGLFLHYYKSLSVFRVCNPSITLLAKKAPS
jgi:hypothetical protein